MYRYMLIIFYLILILATILFVFFRRIRNIILNYWYRELIFQKKIIFIYKTKSINTGSTKSRGTQIGNYINKKYRINYLLIHYNTIKELKKINKNSILIWIKCLPMEHFIKNINIIDIVDKINLLDQDLSFYNTIIFPNKKCYDDYKNKFKCINTVCIYHHYDPDFSISSKKNDQISIIYVGKKGQFPNFLENDNRIYKIFNNYNNVPKVIENYNVHLSIRPTNTNEYLYKPNSKISFAASCDSILITCREPSIMQFKCMENYPYLMDDYSLDSFNKCLELVKNTYKTQIWENALKIMSIIKKQTNLNIIGDQYYNKVIKKLVNSKNNTFN